MSLVSAWFQCKLCRYFCKWVLRSGIFRKTNKPWMKCIWKQHHLEKCYHGQQKMHSMQKRQRSWIEKDSGISRNITMQLCPTFDNVIIWTKVFRAQMNRVNVWIKTNFMNLIKPLWRWQSILKSILEYETTPNQTWQSSFFWKNEKKKQERVM